MTSDAVHPPSHSPTHPSTHSLTHPLSATAQHYLLSEKLILMTTMFFPGSDPGGGWEARDGERMGEVHRQHYHCLQTRRRQSRAWWAGHLGGHVRSHVQMPQGMFSIISQSLRYTHLYTCMLFSLHLTCRRHRVSYVNDNDEEYVQ